MQSSTYVFSGGGASKAPRSEELDSIIYNELQITLSSLAIERKDVVPFWVEFVKIDLDSTGKIGLEEAAMAKKVPLTDYGKCVLNEMDLDGDGSLKFSEFYVGLWNFLAADKVPSP
jgi:Ca2+-binding EF-hand superfamily protein